METIDAEIDGTTLKILVKVARLDAATVREFKRDVRKSGFPRLMMFPWI